MCRRCGAPAATAGPRRPRLTIPSTLHRRPVPRRGRGRDAACATPPAPRRLRPRPHRGRGSPRQPPDTLLPGRAAPARQPVAPARRGDRARRRGRAAPRHRHAPRPAPPRQRGRPRARVGRARPRRTGAASSCIGVVAVALTMSVIAVLAGACSAVRARTRRRRPRRGTARRDEPAADGRRRRAHAVRAAPLVLRTCRRRRSARSRTRCRSSARRPSARVGQVSMRRERARGC